MTDAARMTRKICVITGTRAEYGLLTWIMRGLAAGKEFSLQTLVTGMHLSPEFGLTYREIERDGFRIDRKIEMLTSSDTPVGIAKSMGLGLIGFADAFQELRPDLILVLGDRFEIFCAVAAALVARIPVVHLHGGELSEGAVDDAIRHAITKMSHFHFVATEPYRRRVIQLGEDPQRVFLVGGLGIDNIKRLQLLDQASLEQELQFEFGAKNLLVTFHPVTIEHGTAAGQMAELLAALSTRSDIRVIFTMPNADTDGRVLIGMINDYVATHPRQAKAFTSLGQVRYLSAMFHADAVVGNSSSGIIEAPSFGKGTINIGDRQRGRLMATSVINCMPDKASIIKAIDRIYSTEFKTVLQSVVNPYGNGGASEKVIDMLKTLPLDGPLLKKQFYDIGITGKGEHDNR